MAMATVEVRAMGGICWVITRQDGTQTMWEYGTLDLSGQYEQDEDEVREAAAEYLGCSPEDIDLR